jgi:hypothetical protein
VHEFVKWNSWWEQRYRAKIEPGGRFHTTKVALNLLLQRNGSTIVETGTIRSRGDYAGAGMATLTFGAFCARYGKRLWTVDILPEAIALARKQTPKYAEAITYVTGDSVEFLQKFPMAIDLLYLDSFDCPVDDSDPDRLREAQEHQLREIQAAWDKLDDRSIVLLDDNDFVNGGKCRLSNEFLADHGWTCLIADKQALWISDVAPPSNGVCPE